MISPSTTEREAFGGGRVRAALRSTDQQQPEFGSTRYPPATPTECLCFRKRKEGRFQKHRRQMKPVKDRKALGATLMQKKLRALGHGVPQVSGNEGQEMTQAAIIQGHGQATVRDDGDFFESIFPSHLVEFNASHDSESAAWSYIDLVNDHLEARAAQ